MRFNAWWKGYDVADMEARLQRQNLAKRAGSLSGVLKKSLGDAKKLPWSTIRIRLVQLVWGEGYCGPGGPNHIIEMTKLLDLKPEKSMMLIGAGIGGPARTLAKEYGVWVDGYEESEKLVNKGTEMSTHMGLSKKARLIHKDLNNISSFERQYDCAFSKEILYRVENKLELLQAIYDNLKPGSLFLFSDVVAKNAECLQQTSVRQWIQQEPLKPYPVTSDQLVRMLKQCGFSIRVNEDITKQYIRLVAEGWSDAETLVDALVERGEGAKESLLTVAKEARLWELRKKNMNSGDLRVTRYLVHKKVRIA